MLKTPLMSHQVKVGAYYFSLCYHAVPLSLNCSCMLTPELRVILQSCSNLHTVHSHTDITYAPITYCVTEINTGSKEKFALCNGDDKKIYVPIIPICCGRN